MKDFWVFLTKFFSKNLPHVIHVWSKSRPFESCSSCTLVLCYELKFLKKRFLVSIILNHCRPKSQWAITICYLKKVRNFCQSIFGPSISIACFPASFRKLLDLKNHLLVPDLTWHKSSMQKIILLNLRLISRKSMWRRNYGNPQELSILGLCKLLQSFIKLEANFNWMSSNIRRVLILKYNLIAI